MSNAVEALQQYSYQYNIKIVGFPQANESESSEDTAKLCLQLYSAPACLSTVLRHMTLTSPIVFTEERVLLVTN